MFADTTTQLRLILACIVFGFLSGILWDFLRAFRPQKGANFINTLFDIILVTAFFITLFILGYTVGGGVQRIYAPLFALLSCALYFCGLTEIFRSIFEKAARLLRKIFAIVLFPFHFLLKTIKKLCKFVKKSFYSSKICYTIKYKRKSAKDEEAPEKGTAYEAEKGKYYY